MKKRISQIIKIMGIGMDELIIDIDLLDYTINSIEWSESENKIYLHIFHSDLDIEIDFDDISKENKKILLLSLSQLIYN